MWIAIFLFPPHKLSDFSLQHGTISLPLAKTCFQIWSLFLFLRSGIQLCFTASMSVPLFVASQIRYHPCQIRYHQCETKMKRSQIGVRSRRISGLLCVLNRPLFLSFFFSGLVSNFWPKPGIHPSIVETGLIQPVFKLVQNTNISILVYAPIWDILANTVWNRLPWLDLVIIKR